MSSNVSSDKAFKAIYPDDMDMFNVIKYSHRTYFNQLHSMTSEVFMLFCRHQNVQVRIGAKSKVNSAIGKLRSNIPTEFHNAIDRFEKELKPPTFPKFNDYFEAIFKHVNLSKQEKTGWRATFEAFTIIRNKVSHESAPLTEREIKVLEQSGLDIQIEDKEFKTNFRLYNELAIKILDFLDLIMKRSVHSS